jgi:hypothetical protein
VRAVAQAKRPANENGKTKLQLKNARKREKEKEIIRKAKTVQAPVADQMEGTSKEVEGTDEAPAKKKRKKSAQGETPES